MFYTDVKPRQWHVLKEILPPNPRRGRPFRDHQQVINGIIWRLKTGAPWRCIPERYSPWQTIYDRFRRWERSGVWEEILVRLQGEQAVSIDWDALSLDATSVKAHRCASGARHQPAVADQEREAITGEWIGRSRGGGATQLHLTIDQHVRPLVAYVTEGQVSDGATLLATLERLHVNAPGRGRPRSRPKSLRVDRAYGARSYRQALRRRGIRCVCPERTGAKAARLRKGSKGGRPPAFDAAAYKQRNAVERLANRLKDFRAVATRYEKRARSYRACVLVAMIMLWL